METPLVSILMGSRSDLEIMKPASEVLDEFGIAHEIRVLSAHRSTDALFEYTADAEKRGVQVFIAGAGGAAHLPGVIAAKTLLPVIGVPVDSTPLLGLDALLAIVQMPKGTPVATVAVGKAGAGNAGHLAVQILALGRPQLREKLVAWKEKRREALIKDSVVR